MQHSPKPERKPAAIIFIGPPGSGKGTQATSLKEYKHLSTGDLLRAEIAQGSVLGISCKELIARGEMVSDKLISELLEAHFAPKILLDGFPRTLTQAEWLKEKVDLKRVFFFSVDVEKLVRRLTARRVCPQCKAVYNLLSKTPQKEGICDVCHTPIIQRPDDVEEVIRNRMHLYQKETAPVIAHYEKEGLLTTLDASLSVEEIQKQIHLKLT